MDEVIAAFATDDGTTFINRHFGDAKYYLIYKIFSSSAEIVTKIVNTTEDDDEEIHADPEKARSVVELLKSKKIQVVVSKIFGPNIKRIKKKFVCIAIKEKNIADSMKLVCDNFEMICCEWEKGEERKHLLL